MSSFTIANTAAELIPENRLRKSLVIQNEDASINIFIKQEEPGNTTASTTDHDLRLGPGVTVALNDDLDGVKQLTGRYTAIAASGTPRVSIYETEDVRR